MKRTKIKYRVTADNMIEILDIENVASREELKKEFGEEVTRIYTSKFPYYYRDFIPFTDSSKKGVLIFTPEAIFNVIYLRERCFYTKANFELRIQLMKQAGKKLQQIKKDVENVSEPKIILI